MQITEPMTMATDYILAVFALILAIKLWRGQTTSQQSQKLWAGALIATALAALVGGTSHGFALYFNDITKAAIWKITVYAIGVGSLLMLSGTIIGSVSGRWRNGLLIVVVLHFLIYAVWMIAHNDFKYVIFDYVPAMLAIIFLQGYAFFKRRDASATWLIAGVLVSFAAAGIQQSGIVLHQHFNYNDIYHIVQMGGMYLLYRGASLLTDL